MRTTLQPTGQPGQGQKFNIFQNKKLGRKGAHRKLFIYSLKIMLHPRVKEPRTYLPFILKTSQIQHLYGKLLFERKVLILTLPMYSESRSCRAWRTALHSATILSRRSSRVQDESAIRAAPLMMLSRRSSREGLKRSSLKLKGSTMICFCRGSIIKCYC